MPSCTNGCGFFAYSWKLPAYNGAYLLTIDKLAFYLQLELFHLHFSGIKMTRVSKMSLLIFVVFARFLPLTARFWQVNDHRKMQELTMNQSKTTLFRSRNLKGLVFLSPEF